MSTGLLFEIASTQSRFQVASVRSFSKFQLNTDVSECVADLDVWLKAKTQKPLKKICSAKSLPGRWKLSLYPEEYKSEAICLALSHCNKSF